MGIVTYEGQIESSLPPAKLFRMLVLESDTSISKVQPEAVQRFETLQGDGGPGTVRKITFGDGSPSPHVITTVDLLDRENFTFHYSLIGGHPALIDTSIIEKMSFQLKFEATPNGGTIATRSGKSYTINGVEVNEEEVRAGLEQNTQVFYEIFKAYEAYALANPDAYN
ncbi:hypothetical protein JCGZ_09814 [Jatropha curcas]|uniref:Bet v I/Major latex protein domain-containing protein n=1 Tax=Jatropha curcas TaxID=180498 RepID=A0A067KWR0_JATCU|nr:major allergen Pru av 1 [Jatropha curcas]KDP36249.1 hypothetical protein JCGZ_09814 [Jatropha curcas]